MRIIPATNRNKKNNACLKTASSFIQLDNISISTPTLENSTITYEKNVALKII